MQPIQKNSVFHKVSHSIKSIRLIRTGLALVFCVVIIIPSVRSQDVSDSRGLKDYYADYFPVGASLAPRNIRGDEENLVLKHFNSITAENVMKVINIHPHEARYDWRDADKLAEFAVKNNLLMRGHTLVWHRQVPTWIFTDEDDNMVSCEVLLDRMREHITDVVSRYKGKIYAWDVVNEAVADSGPELVRDSPWSSICGEDFIARAFEYAHAADPDALLFYNDYNTTDPTKREKIYTLVKSLREKGVPVHGIGMQGHWSIYGPGEQEIHETITRFASLGVVIHITELDVSVYPPENGRRERRPEESVIFTPEMEARQADQYRMFFKVFREHKDVVRSVTFWNLSDRRSWLDNFPVRGRKNYPLLFDQELKPKKAYWEVIRF